MILIFLDNKQRGDLIGIFNRHGASLSIAIQDEISGSSIC